MHNDYRFHREKYVEVDVCFPPVARYRSEEASPFTATHWTSSVLENKYDSVKQSLFCKQSFF